MPSRLFFLCPTDCLESVINTKYDCANYFYTSLGNVLSCDNGTINNIKGLIKKHQIQTLYLVLSDQNQVVQKLLDRHPLPDINALKRCYQDLQIQETHVKAAYPHKQNKFSIISYYLNHKIKELQFELRNFQDYPLNIIGQIYEQHQGQFTDIYSGLICIEKQQLN